jgi:hypothetical protein
MFNLLKGCDVAVIDQDRDNHRVWADGNNEVTEKGGRGGLLSTLKIGYL